MVFWHPPGWSIYQTIEQYMREQQRLNGYDEIKTPQLVDLSLWEKSGHADKFGNDMFMFNATQVTQPDFIQDRLQDSRSAPPSRGWLKDLIVSLWSLDALGASWATLRGQSRRDHVPYLANGMRHPQRNRIRIISAGGHHAAFTANERYSLVADDGWAKFDRTPGILGVDSPMDTFRALVRFCREEEIDLYLFISPIHARKQEVLWQFGLWTDFEDWNRCKLMAGEPTALIDYHATGKMASLSAPTPEHYLPLLYLAGVQEKTDDVSFPVEGIDGGTMSMLSVLLTSRVLDT